MYLSSVFHEVVAEVIHRLVENICLLENKLEAGEFLLLVMGQLTTRVATIYLNKVTLIIVLLHLAHLLDFLSDL